MRDRAKPRFTRKSHAACKLALVVFVAWYAVVADWGGETSARGEFFPVFNWSLFTYVKPVRGLLELYVVRIGDHTFPQPINYFELDSYFATVRNRSTDLKKTMERLA